MKANARQFAVIVPLGLPLAYLAASGALSAPLPAFDETGYYMRALAVWQGVPPSPEFSPLYTLVYALFARPGVSPDDAYHAMRLATVSVLVMSAYFGLATTLDRPSAFLGSFLIAFNPLITSSYTIYVASAATAAIAMCFAATRPRIALGVLALGILVRPESAVVLAAAAVLIVAAGRARPQALLPLLPLVAGIAAYFVAVPSIYDDIPGGRFAVAFGQHYGWTLTDLGWQGDHWNDWQAVLANDFGEARTPLALLQANPQAILVHLQHNLSILPLSWLISVGPLSAMVWLVWLAVHVRQLPPTPRPALLLALSLLALLGPWLVIRPRPDYLLTLACPSLLLLAMGVRWVARRHPAITTNERAPEPPGAASV